MIELGVYNRRFLPTDCRSHAPLFDNVTVSRIGGFVSGVDDQAAAGPQAVPWDGKDRNGRAVASGVYFCELVADDVRESLKLVLIE